MKADTICCYCISKCMTEEALQNPTLYFNQIFCTSWWTATPSCSWNMHTLPSQTKLTTASLSIYYTHGMLCCGWLVKQGLCASSLTFTWNYWFLVFNGLHLKYHNLSKNMPMGDELQWLLKEGGGRIFESCDISFENMPTSHAVSLALVIRTCNLHNLYKDQILSVDLTNIAY